MNIAWEDDSNIFELLKNFWLNSLQFIILKCSRFCLFVTFVFILLLLYTQMLILSFPWLEKERKKQFKSQPSPKPLKFSLSSNLPYFPTPPTISFWYFFQLILLFHTCPSIRNLREIDCISRRNYWNKVNFGVLMQVQQS